VSFLQSSIGARLVRDQIEILLTLAGALARLQHYPLDTRRARRVAFDALLRLTLKLIGGIQAYMPAIVSQRNVGPVTILELGPRLTLIEGTELRDTTHDLLAQGRSTVLLDCVRVNFIDSQGIGCLVRTWVSSGRGGKLKLFSLTPRFKETLRITGLLKVMDCFEDVESALQSFSRQASA